MTSNRFGPRFAPLRFDAARCFVPFTSLSRDHLVAIHAQVDAARRELLGSSEDQPVGAISFVDAPRRLLADYRQSRRESELGRILSLGKRLRETVDRVVIFSRADGLLGPRALFAAACHPYHNELSRGDRGGRPRIYFVESRSGRLDYDNDALQGLLDLLGHARRTNAVEERWALLTIDTAANRTAEPTDPAALSILLEALQRSCGGRDAAAPLLVPIANADTGASSVANLAADFGCQESFLLPTGLWAAHGVLMAAGLVPAALMGIDVVALLKGAEMFGEQFRNLPIGKNPALDFAAVLKVAGPNVQSTTERFIAHTRALEATATWCNKALTQRETPVDPKLQSHYALSENRPRPDGIAAQIIVDTYRRDRLLASETLERTNGISLAGVSELYLPSCEESSLGQLFQMMMLAAEIRLRLHGPAAAAAELAPE